MPFEIIYCTVASARFCDNQRLYVLGPRLSVWEFLDLKAGVFLKCCNEFLQFHLGVGPNIVFVKIKIDGT